MGYVNVPVPEERVPEVYAMLAGPPAGEPSTNGAAEWAKDGIVRMYRESPPAMKAVLDHMADHPGEEFMAPEMAKIIGRTRAQFRGVLGAFGHRVHSRYRWKKWPIDWRWDNQQSTAAYRMSAAVAEIIKQARQA